MVKQKLAPFLRLNKKTFVVDGAAPRGATCLRTPGCGLRPTDVRRAHALGLAAVIVRQRVAGA